MMKSQWKLEEHAETLCLNGTLIVGFCKVIQCGGEDKSTEWVFTLWWNGTEVDHHCVVEPTIEGARKLCLGWADGVIKKLLSSVEVPSL